MSDLQLIEVVFDFFNHNFYPIHGSAAVRLPFRSRHHSNILFAYWASIIEFALDMSRATLMSMPQLSD